MNKSYILCCTLFLFSEAKIYSQDYSFSNYPNIIYQKIDVKNYSKKLFKLEAKIKVDTSNGDGSAFLGAIQQYSYDDSGKYYYNCTGCDNQIRKNEWIIYTVTGKIEKRTDSLLIGGLFALNGIFCFDDFKLSIEEEKGEWKNIPLQNSYFDLNTSNKLNMIPDGWQQTSFDQRTLSLKNLLFPPQYNYRVDDEGYLEISGSGLFHLGMNQNAGRYVLINGVKIYYETYGNGEPLLLLHGNGGSIVDFENQIPEFVKIFNIIAVDSRAQGNSTDSKNELNYDLMAADMNEFLDSLHLDSVNVLGWSDGGNTGLIMAIKYPLKVKKLAVMGANLYPDESAVHRKYLRWAKVMKFFLTVVGIFNNEVRHDKKLVKMLLKHPNINPNDLLKIKIPVLVMAGENDIIKEEHTRLIAKCIPNSQLVIFPDATHFIPWENPIIFNSTVLNFLRNP